MAGCDTSRPTGCGSPRWRGSFRAVLAGYQAHYNTARPHQGIAQRVPDDERETHPATVTDVDTRQIRRKSVLGGLINEYVHAA
jgi:putative transposase